MASRRASDAQQVPPGSLLLVVHDFVARSPDELSLTKGDRIELIERDDDFGDGWFLGRHMTKGTTGLFPEVYTTPAPKATLPMSPTQHRGTRLSPLSPTAPQPPLLSSRAPTSASAIEHLAQDTPSANAPPQHPLSSRVTPPANPPQPRNTNQAAAAHNSVMHETLSVIDEHITDLKTPRTSYLNAGLNNNHDDDSIYSTHDGHRLSYINGHETDEEEAEDEENKLRTEAQVMAWSPARVAEYLEENGVEKPHCDMFREQEISGEVLIHMEQSAIFIKEFELGSVGRRLKTWQKIKELQDEVKASAASTVARSLSDYSVGGDESTMGETPTRTRSASVTTSSQRPMTANTMASSYTAGSPLASMSPKTIRSENTARPSAASIRSLNHSRRHSSLGSIDPGPPPSSSRFSRQSIAAASAASAAPPATAAGNAVRRRSSIQDSRVTSNPSQYETSFLGNFGFGSMESPLDFDRGYFSGNEVDNRNKRNVLQKKSIPRSVDTDTDLPGHIPYGRMTSLESMREPVSPVLSMESTNSRFERTTEKRSVSSPQPVAAKPLPLRALQGPASPVVTKLEYGDSAAWLESDNSSANPSPSPAAQSFSFFSKSRLGGLRIASDAVTQNEKRAQSNLKGSPITSPTRTGSTTPSTDTRSFELQKPDSQSRVSTGSSSALAPPAPNTRSRTKPKTKKSTSAYTRGLEKKAPAEQIAGSDYSGWMKKKSSNLMGSWKPRLFVLRGRRLSYYYSENDTEEKGLIDISSHRVLPAEKERMTGLYAALTGASSSPIMPSSATTPTSAASDLAAKPSPDSESGLFIFKLVPPRQGLSKAVNFTKPAVHYFAVNSRQEGRLWMAALMKATIDYDPSGKVVTSYSHKTISLAKARARNERPPALREFTDEPGKDEKLATDLEGGATHKTIPSMDSTGLGINGLDAAHDNVEQNAVAGAEQ